MRFLTVSLFVLLVACAPTEAPAPLYHAPVYNYGQTDILPSKDFGENQNNPDEVQFSAPVPVKEQVTPQYDLKPVIKEKTKVALLVPLSGESANLGKALLDAAQLALFDINNSNLEIIPIDTSEKPESARLAVQKAINNNVKLILGPLFSEAALAAAPIAKERGINLISFSNNRELTDEGIFLLGFMPEQQVERVVNFAYDRGIRDFSAIVPESKFGEIVVAEFKSVLRGKFSSPKNIDYYTSIDETLSLIIDKYAGGAEDSEKEKVESEGLDNKQLLEKIKQELERKKRASVKQAILVPEGGRVASTIAARLFLRGSGTENIKLLGTGQWDDPDILREKKLVGSWFATSSPTLRKIFEKHFKDTYGYVPVRIASLAYDGLALAAYLADKQDFSSSAITSRRGFSGMNGVFRIKSDGTSERALAVLEITNKGFEVVDPAPSDFNSF